MKKEIREKHSSGLFYLKETVKNNRGQNLFYLKVWRPKAINHTFFNAYLKEEDRDNALQKAGERFEYHKINVAERRAERKLEKRPTVATFKKFIRENFNKLYIKVESHFDGMTDMVEQNYNAQFSPAQLIDKNLGYTLGILGVWLVGGSRDYISRIDTNEYTGLRFSNACGSGIVAIKK